ncbi:response regulator transcription factor [Paenibacillus chungangensis]|uniref:Response regulator n=1 Tax=Paenibacillus chungangensis TaxID=696535 RepID=A0ABW3HKK5_9BACL
MVDDEAIVRSGVRVLLQQCHEGITIVGEARHGAEALSIMENETPDLVITDIRMPEMDGLELIKHIRHRFPDMPVIILTGYADFDYARSALQYGVTQYLLKPVTQESINEAVWTILSKDPVRWVGELDSHLLKEVKELVTDLVKAVLSENLQEVERIILYTKKICDDRQLSLLAIKQLLGYLRLTYFVEMLVHRNDLPDIKEMLNLNGLTKEEWFRDWLLHAEAQVRWISSKRMPRNKRLVEGVVQDIHLRYHEADLSLPVLAEKFGVTATHLSKMFREIMHYPISLYIGKYRLEMARKLLEQNKTTLLSDIAEQCGFNDYPHFSKMFKRHFGVSPQEYRDKQV